MQLNVAGLTLPVRLVPATPLSDEQLLRFCESNRDLPVGRDADGQLLVLTPVNPTTGHKELRIGRYLDAWADEDGRGLAFSSNSGFTLPDTSMRAPDAAWMSYEKWNRFSDEERHQFTHVCPDFVVELRSPSDALTQLQQKMESWIANGASLAWLIDLIERAITIYRPGREPECLDNLSQVTGEAPVAGFVLPLNRIFT